MKRKTIYWLSQIGGWGAYFSLNTFFQANIIGHFLLVALMNGVLCVSGILFTHLYTLFIHRYQWAYLSPGKLVHRLILASLIIATLWSLPNNFLQIFVYKSAAVPEVRESPIFILLQTLNHAIVILGWSLIYFAVAFFRNYRKAEVERWKSEARAREAEMNILKAQINPHFLFNSLNNIRALILEEPGQAREMLTHLSDFLRYTLKHSDNHTVSLAREMEMVEDYLALNSIHLEERLQWKIDLQGDILHFQVPPMVLQQLVENGIKHGISTLPGGGLINIRGWVEHGQLFLMVENSGVLKPSSEGTQIGVRNLRERLKLTFGEDTEFNLSESEGMVRAEVRLAALSHLIKEQTV